VETKDSNDKKIQMTKRIERGNKNDENIKVNKTRRQESNMTRDRHAPTRTSS